MRCGRKKGIFSYLKSCLKDNCRDRSFLLSLGYSLPLSMRFLRRSHWMECRSAQCMVTVAVVVMAVVMVVVIKWG